MDKPKMSFAKRLRVATTLLSILVMLFAMIFADRVPLHQRVLIQGIGVDAAENGGYDVTVQAISTSASASVEVYQASGESLYEALNNITLVTGKAPFYTHNSVLIIGKACAEKGLNHVMDFFVRHHQTRPAENVFLAEKKAGEILTLQTSPQLSVENQQVQVNQYVMAGQIEQLASAGDLDSQLLEVHVLDVANALYGGSSDVILPILSVRGESIAVEGSAVFFGEKLRGTLDRRATLGIQAVRNKLTGGAVKLSMEDGESATLDFLESDCRVETEIRDGVPHFSLFLTCGMGIDEIDRPLRRTLSREDFDQLGSLAAKRIKAMVEQSLEMTLREYRADVVQFSNALLRQQTGWWKANEKNWRTLLEQCTFSVSVDASIADGGQEMSPALFAPVSLF